MLQIRFYFCSPRKLYWLNQFPLESLPILSSDSSLAFCTVAHRIEKYLYRRNPLWWIMDVHASKSVNFWKRNGRFWWTGWSFLKPCPYFPSILGIRAFHSNIVHRKSNLRISVLWSEVCASGAGRVTFWRYEYLYAGITPSNTYVGGIAPSEFSGNCAAGFRRVTCLWIWAFVRNMKQHPSS